MQRVTVAIILQHHQHPATHCAVLVDAAVAVLIGTGKQACRSSVEHTPLIAHTTQTQNSKGIGSRQELSEKRGYIPTPEGEQGPKFCCKRAAVVAAHQGVFANWTVKHKPHARMRQHRMLLYIPCAQENTHGKTFCNSYTHAGHHHNWHAHRYSLILSAHTGQLQQQYHQTTRRAAAPTCSASRSSRSLVGRLLLLLPPVPHMMWKLALANTMIATCYSKHRNNTATRKQGSCSHQLHRQHAQQRNATASCALPVAPLQDKVVIKQHTQTAKQPGVGMQPRCKLRAVAPFSPNKRL